MHRDTIIPALLSLRNGSNRDESRERLLAPRIPNPRPIHPDRPSLCTAIPVELRLQIWDLTMELSGVPGSYGYTGLPTKRQPSTTPDLPLPDDDMVNSLPLSPTTDVSRPPRSLIEAWVEEQANINESMQQFFRNEKRYQQVRQRFRLEQLYKQQLQKAEIDNINMVLLGHRMKDEHALREMEDNQQATHLPSVSKTHSMILVNKMLGAEYRGVFYQRTNFFFRLDHPNMARGYYGIESIAHDRTIAVVPAFWRIPSDFVSNIRHCTLFVELSVIESLAFAFDKSQRFTEYMPILDAALAGSVGVLFVNMRQLRNLHLIWDTDLEDRGPSKSDDPREMQVKTDEYNWRVFIWQFMILKARPSLQHVSIKVGNARRALQLKARRERNGQLVRYA